MILSSRHKFIFVAIPKTATHAIRAVIRPQLGPYDWEQCSLFVQKKIPIPSIAKMRHGHQTANMIREALSPGVWNQFYRFCFVRNPYDRFVSYCRYMYGNSEAFNDDPSGFLVSLITNEALFTTNIWLWPQHLFTHNNGLQLVDFIGRFENLKEELNQVLKYFNLPLIEGELAAKNKSMPTPYIDLPYEVVQFLNVYYEQDFHLFGYPFRNVDNNEK